MMEREGEDGGWRGYELEEGFFFKVVGFAQIYKQMEMGEVGKLKEKC